MAALPGDAWHDVMTYCQTQWLSSYTYTGIRTRLVAEDSLGPGPSPGPGGGPGGGGRPDERFPAMVQAPAARASQPNLISVVATVNLSKGEGKIQYVNPLPQGEVTPLDPNSPAILRVKAINGQLLHEFPVPVKTFSDPDPEHDRLGLVDAVIAVSPDAKVIELFVAGKLADSFRAAGVRPAIRGIQRMEAEPSQLALSWETGAQLADGNSYTIQVSTDYGRTWQTLGVGLTTPQIKIDPSQFRGASHVLVRVIATDGFTRSEVTSELFPIDSGSSAEP